MPPLPESPAKIAISKWKGRRVMRIYVKLLMVAALVVPTLVFDDFPGGTALGRSWLGEREEGKNEGCGDEGAQSASFGNGVRGRMCSHDPRVGKIYHTGTVGVGQVGR